VACSSLAGPDASGPEFFKASIDGSAWPPTDSIVQGAILHPPGGRFYIQAADVRDTSRSDRLAIAGDFHGLGHYQLAGIYSSAAAVYARPDGSFFETTEQHRGRLTITGLDTVNQVVAGTFSFVAKRVADTLTVRVANGAFRVQYSYRAVTP
jgi:hypothetical protein